MCEVPAEKVLMVEINQSEPVERLETHPQMILKQWRMKELEIRQKTTSHKLVKREKFVTTKAHYSKKLLEELTPITLKEMKVPMIHEGRYLICKTIVHALNITETQVLIEDRNGDIEHLQLENFQFDIWNDPKWLSKGSILLIKEPFLKFDSIDADVVILCESPSDVIFLSENHPLLKDTSFFKPPTLSFEELKSKGNDCFNVKNYEKALMLYNEAFEMEPNPVICLNKAAVLLELGRFSEAFDEAKAALESGINDEKAHYRMGKAAYGMRQWKAAVEAFFKLVQLIPSNESYKNELECSKCRWKESLTGNYDMKKILYLFFVQNLTCIDVADYKGPVDVVHIEGKGKGLVVTKNVKSGTLLLASKAFAFTDDKEIPANVQYVHCNLISRKLICQSYFINRLKVIQTLKNNPEMSNQLYSLYSGVNYNSTEFIPPKTIDTERLLAIYSINGIGPPSKILQPQIAQYETDSFNGLWILPSFINHSCIENVTKSFFGDLLMVHALVDLKKGDEVYISYIDSFCPYEVRCKLLDKYDFQCSCSLCKHDSIDNRSGQHFKGLANKN